MLREKFGMEVNARVFFGAAGLILLFVALGLIFSSSMGSALGSVQSGISRYAGWFYILVVDAVLVFSIYLMLSPYGRIRLGGRDAEPDFSFFAWLAMLFSAGMGIGLVFWSVAEPITHFGSPPTGEGSTAAAARQAMRLTFYHWGLHPWAIYSIVGLALAYFSYNRGLPMTIRSVFHPILGKRIYGPIGDLIDMVAVVATLFGVATSLGFGVQQVAAGLNFVFGISGETPTQLVLIAIITALATLSVVLGLDAGIRRLSEINLYLAGTLLLVVFIVGPTLFLLDSFVQNTGAYLGDLPRLSTWTEAYADTGWRDNWTIFYWGWWISWSPFVGMFIAQISRGRTIREFLVAVLFAPTILTFIWITVFGNSAIFEELFRDGGIAAAVDENVATALFVLLKKYPLAMITSLIGVLVVVTFFVTSSDSGSLVIDIISAGGHTNPPVGQRIFWAVLEGVVAGVLLLGGGLKALQTAAITIGLPFAVVLGFMCFGLMKALRKRLVAEEIEPEEGPAAKAHEAPGSVEALSAPHHGRGWVILDWTPPETGGLVAGYRIRRRKSGEDKWHEVGMSLQDSAALQHREPHGVWEYQVIPVNRAGEGGASPPVSVEFAAMAR